MELPSSPTYYPLMFECWNKLKDTGLDVCLSSKNCFPEFSQKLPPCSVLQSSFVGTEFSVVGTQISVVTPSLRRLHFKENCNLFSLPKTRIL